MAIPADGVAKKKVFAACIQSASRAVIQVPRRKQTPGFFNLTFNLDLIMNKFLFAAITSLLVSGGAQAANQIAVCESGFAIDTIGANKAACVKTVNVEDDLGPRKCLADGRRTSTEATDGGDMCQGTATPFNSLLMGPAKDCKLDYGANARNKLVQNGQDRCVKTVQRTLRGDINVRNE
jgi:hypothetical protein